MAQLARWNLFGSPAADRIPSAAWRWWMPLVGEAATEVELVEHAAAVG